MEVFSFPAGGFGQRAQHLGARPGSLDQGKITLPGQRGRRDIAPELRQGRKVQCKSEALCEAGRYLAQEKAFYKGGTDWTFQPAQDRGQWARWKAAGSAGRGVPLLSPTLVSSGRRSVRLTLYREARGLRGPENPALCCRPTFVCPCVCLRPSVFVCVPALSGLILFWCIILFSLFWLTLLLPFFSDLPSTPTLFKSFSEQANSCGGNWWVPARATLWRTLKALQ